MGHTSFQYNRRQFLRAGIGTAGALALGPAFFERAFAAGPVTVGGGPYGPPGSFDANGIALPEGFTSREIARGTSLVPGTLYPWHPATDGQATFPTLGPGGAPDGGWILVANSEVPVPALGGVSGVEFAADGRIESAYRVLLGTFVNCAGGPTPWGTWLSCEEHDGGRVWECDPTGANPLGTPRPAMGVFQHEAAAVDPVGKRVYLTEDKGDGCLYRFTPASYPDLSAGLLECAIVDGAGNVSWAAVPDPGGGAVNPTRHQVAGAAHFDGGEGIWHDLGVVYFTTKGDSRVWTYEIASSKLDVLYDEAAVGPDAPLSGVDNITVAPSGDVFVCEDGRDHDICMITPDFEVSRFLKLHPDIHSGPPAGTPIFSGNETVGVVFSPDGQKMYFGAQRSFGLLGIPLVPVGVVYEISGPFRTEGRGLRPPGGGNDTRPPGTSLRAPKRRRIDLFLKRGLQIEVDLDELAGVEAKLWVKGAAKGSGKKLVAQATPGVAVRDRVGLSLSPGAAAKRLLRGRRRVRAELEVVATDSAGNRTTLGRKVELWRKGSGRR